MPDPVLVISDRPDVEIIRDGRRLPAGPLGAQAGATLKLAAGSKAGIEEILGAGFLDAAAALKVQVDAARNDHTLAADDSKEKTLDQGTAARAATLWRRKALKLGAIFKRRGVKEAGALARITSSDKSLNGLRDEVKEKIVLLEKHSGRAPNPAYARKLAEEGALVVKTLEAADASQEVDIKKLPQATRDAYKAMGLLYCALKQINEAGQSVYVHDGKVAAQYNLELLYRGTAKGGAGKDQPKPPRPGGAPRPPAGGAPA